MTKAATGRIGTILQNFAMLIFPGGWPEMNGENGLRPRPAVARAIRPARG